MTFSFTIGWWLFPLTAMWVWLATMFVLGRLTSADVVDFSGPFLIITVMCLLTRFLP